MAISWLLALVRLDNRAAADTRREFLSGSAAVGSQGSMVGGGGGRRAADAISSLTERVASGISRGKIYATVLDNSATYATGNIACTRANAAGDSVTFTYGGVAIALTEGVDFLRGASDTTCAANLAAAINAHPVLGQIFLAAGSTGNCGLTALIPTAIPQDIAMTTSDGTAFSFTQLNGGNEGAAQFFLQLWKSNSI